MKKLVAPDGAPIDIPSRLNIVIAITAYTVAGTLLYLAANAESRWVILMAAIGFSYVNNTIFSLLHESVHGVFHTNKKLNKIFGILSAAFFPTGFTFQRAFHLGHHRRNRTDVELFDMYYPRDSKLLKFLQMYTIILGFYWTAAPIGGIFYLISPRILDWSLFRSQNKYLKPMSMEAMISGLDKIKPSQIRWELIFTLIFQVTLFYFLNLNFWSWLLCYWAFAINWGSIQYADHAWTKRDVRNGAWNLKVNKIIQYIFLNYHLHKAHHQYPYVPWIHLEKFVDINEPKQSHFKIWLRMWRGPTPVTEGPPSELSRDFINVLYAEDVNEVKAEA